MRGAIMKPIGYMDAYEDKIFLDKCFIETECYEKSISKDCNFICGRRGSGKSAIVIKLLENEKYTYTANVKGDEYYSILLDAIEQNDLANNIVLFKEIWRVLIVTTAMNVILQKEYSSSSLIASPDTPMYNYLKNIDFLGNKPFALWQKIIHGATKALSSSANSGNLSVNLCKHIAEVFNNADISEAEESLKKHLASGGKCLIIVDTILDSLVEDKINLFDSVKGLFLAVLEMSCMKYAPNLEVKCCVPGEVYSNIAMWNSRKIKDHLVPIQWEKGTLTRLISKRLMYHLVKKETVSADEFERINWKSDVRVWKDVWMRFATQTIVNLAGKREDTHEYLFRHTQHTPRELIAIMNNVIDYIANIDVVKDLNKQQLQEYIINGVHDACSETADEIINSNAYAIPELETILYMSFLGQQKIMTANILKTNLRKARDIWKRHSSMYNSDYVIKILARIGFIGLILSKNKDKTKAYARFSYLRDDIGISTNSTYAIHPIFYEKFSIQQDKKIAVIPVSDKFVCTPEIDVPKHTKLDPKRNINDE